MSILSTNSRLIKVGQDYSAGSGISIDDHVISVTGEFGKTYSAGDNISIYEQNEQLYISSKDWTNDIANASANAYNKAVSQIPDPFDPTFISAKVDNKLDATAFTNWQNGQYSTDLQTIEGQISNKLDESAFVEVSGSFLTAINIPESAVWQDVSTTVQSNSAQWADGGSGDEEVNSFVYNNSATIVDVDNSYKANSGNFLTAAPSDMATTGDVAELEQTISETYQVKGDYLVRSDSANFYPSNNPSGFVTGVDLSNYYTKYETSGKEELANAFANIPAGDTEVNTYVQNNSATINEVNTTYQSNSSNYITAHQSLDGYATTAWVNEQGYLTEVSIPESATWNEVSTTVQTNSAQWGQGGTGSSSDSFYIYPGTTTNSEVADNSGKNIYLYHSGTNTYLKYAGKITYPKYSIFNFKTVSGTQYNYNKLVNARVNIYPNSNSACKINIIQSIDLLDTNSTVNYANNAYTAYNDGNGNSLSNTYDTVTALSSFVENNSANWGGGSSPTGGDSVLFNLFYYDNSYGNSFTDSYISGATELYFEASMDYQQGSPSDVIITRDGSEVGRANWSQVSSDGYINYFTASYNNPDGGKVGLQHNGINYQCYVSANGLKTNAFEQRSYYCKTNDTIKINVQGSDVVTGNIIGMHQGNSITLTSFTGSLSNFTANGYDQYNTDIFHEDTTNPYNYEVSAELVYGGVTGEFVPQSAFDELKQSYDALSASYDALSSLFATYSGQWLLPNEGV